MRYLNCFNQFIREYEKTYPLPLLEKSIQHMDAVKKLIEEKLKNAAMGEPNPELVQQTIRKFFRWAVKPSTEDFSWLEVALLCRGLLVEIPGYGSLMESENAVKVLLRKFSPQYESAMLSAYPWQGLLNAYLNASPRQNPMLEENWRELRTFLENTLDKVASQSSFKLRWLDALISHRIVLAENATQSLAIGALLGRMERVDRIAYEVNIPSTSWFWPELLMSQVKAITAYHDEKFKPAIDLVLPQLQERKECLDDGLARILDRYAQCVNLESHQELKSTVVSRWKSPSLETQSGWVRVSPEAKRMVQRWLVVEDLKDFFLTLRRASDDDSLDRRRFEFWMQYLDKISFSFLILGPDTRENFQQLLAGKLGRYSALTGTNRANNAFLIEIGKHYIVEFGGVGKTWAYDESKIRPLLNYRSVNYDELRAPDRSLFLRYSESEEGGLAHRGAWEGKFHRALDYLGITPDTMHFDDLLVRYQIKKEKSPSGTLWVRHFYEVGTVSDFLRKQGFFFKSRAEGFYLNPRNMASY
ncbi:MAG: EH signature domain-containing protein [Methylococcales bacterium]|nr:EH signature domain-containing protein [Methylococcales bacterium]